MSFLMSAQYKQRKKHGASQICMSRLCGLHKMKSFVQECIHVKTLRVRFQSLLGFKLQDSLRLVVVWYIRCPVVLDQLWSVTTMLSQQEVLRATDLHDDPGVRAPWCGAPSARMFWSGFHFLWIPANKVSRFRV